MAAKKKLVQSEAENVHAGGGSAVAATADLCDAYWDHVLEHGQVPASVFKFCKSVGIDEADFYRRYGSFDSLEADFWTSTIQSAVATLDSDPETVAYDARQLLLAFYFTYMESIVAHRSKFLLRFPSIRSPGGRALEGFRREFDAFSSRVIQKAREDGLIAELKQLNSLQEKGLYPQFRFLIDFHLKDASRGFEDSDALIEKTVRFFFDAARFPVLESSLDLLRFLAPRLRSHWT